MPYYSRQTSADSDQRTANPKLVIGGILMMLYGLVLFLLSAALFLLMQKGGFWGGDDTKTHSDFALPIIALVAGLNVETQGIWLLRTKNKMVERIGFWLILGVLQAPLLIIVLSQFGLHAALSRIMPSWFLEGEQYTSVGISVVASILLWACPLLADDVPADRSNHA